MYNKLLIPLRPQPQATRLLENTLPGYKGFGEIFPLYLGNCWVLARTFKGQPDMPDFIMILENFKATPPFQVGDITNSAKISDIGFELIGNKWSWVITLEAA